MNIQNLVGPEKTIAKLQCLVEAQIPHYSGIAKRLIAEFKKHGSWSQTEWIQVCDVLNRREGRRDARDYKVKATGKYQCTDGDYEQYCEDCGNSLMYCHC